MHLAYAVADLVVCRSGAGSVGELAALGMPAVYVPLPVGNGEQRLNAAAVVEAGGGLLVDDADLTPPGSAPRCCRSSADPAGGPVADGRSRGRRRVARTPPRPSSPSSSALPRRVDDAARPSTDGLTVADLGRHLVGIGGAGMSVVARLLAARGVRVQGSDARRSSAVTDARVASGIQVWVGHDAAHVARAQTLVLSSAVRAENPELVAAHAAGLSVLHRSQALAPSCRVRAPSPSRARTARRRRRRWSPRPARGGSRPLLRDRRHGAHRQRRDRRAALGSSGTCSSPRPTSPTAPSWLQAHGRRGDQRRARPPRPLRDPARRSSGAFVQFARASCPAVSLVACADDAGAARLVDRGRAQPDARDVDVCTYDALAPTGSKSSATCGLTVGGERGPDVPGACSRSGSPCRWSTTRSMRAAPGRCAAARHRPCSRGPWARPRLCPARGPWPRLQGRCRAAGPPPRLRPR